jgi:hypothetical protein
MMHKLQALLTERRTVLSGMANNGLFIFDSCFGRPMTINSDFD